MIVILAEKPSQAKAYADAFSGVKRQEGFFEIPPCPFFQQGAKLTWGIGHLVELKEPHEYKGEWKKWNLSTLPVVPETFQFRVSPGKSKQFNIVKQLLKESQEIIVATDCDREGENIARSIITLAGASRKPTKRLWINSLEVDEVRRGFTQLREGTRYLPFYYEAQARQISDWVVGINSSRLYTLLLQQKGIKDVFSVGRVQTPTLKLIYDRQKAIENFKPEPFYELEALFNTEVGDYKGKVKEKFKSEEDVQDLLQKQQIIPNQPMPGNVKSVEVSLKRQKAPKLHSLSSLQSLANRKYKYSPKKVLDLVQSLYDSPLKLVTYPRTDTPYITENEFAYLKEGIGGYQQVIGHPFQPARLQPNKNYVDGSKVQEHYAIVPTKNIPKPGTIEKLSREQKNIYFEIVKSVLAMFHRDYQYEETNLVTAINQVDFLTRGKVEIDPGWKELFRNDPKEEEKKDEDATILPPVKEGMDATGIVSAKKGMTQPPKPYTEGQLIQMMKTCGQAEELSAEEKSILKEVEGLGTEATRSGIIETLKKQKYIEVRKNQSFRNAQRGNPMSGCDWNLIIQTGNDSEMGSVFKTNWSGNQIKRNLH